MDDDDAHCLDCGVAINPGADQCGRCARRIWTGWIGLGFLLLGLPLAVVGTGFAFATSKGIGYAVTLVWMVGALGLVMAVTGAVDLIRAVKAKAAGKRAPRPWATKWVTSQLGM